MAEHPDAPDQINLPPKVVEMAKKKLLPPARNTQAPRKRKQTPPKKKGQLVKFKGKPTVFSLERGSFPLDSRFKSAARNVPNALLFPFRIELFHPAA